MLCFITKINNFESNSQHLKRERYHPKHVPHANLFGQYGDRELFWNSKIEMFYTRKFGPTHELKKEIVNIFTIITTVE